MHMEYIQNLLYYCYTYSGGSSNVIFFSFVYLAVTKQCALTAQKPRISYDWLDMSH